MTSIVSEGTVTTDMSGLGVATSKHDGELVGMMGSATSRSVLAAKLAPPVRPAAAFGYGWVGVFLFSRIGLGLFSLALILAIVACSFPILVGTYRENPALVLIPIFGVTVFVVLLLRWIVVSLVREVRKIRNDRAGYPAEVETWERALERWKELYYCSRDDGVFLPSHSVLVPSVQMKQYLYAKSGEKLKREPLKLKMDSRKNRS
ncbi:MAG: hypothetical protein IPO91_25260 [Chloroflexi bacterium]|nr:hypothetical protein [Chloroflexota bacterium]